ncbi:hypothetical protein C8Q72DRAFT_943183 [Fomitopsis betulina]|nr:hypothetical protein C8Q72DRAFT_943183 [Fomitopsis betulina]
MPARPNWRELRLGCFRRSSPRTPTSACTSLTSSKGLLVIGSATSQARTRRAVELYLRFFAHTFLVYWVDWAAPACRTRIRTVCAASPHIIALRSRRGSREAQEPSTIELLLCRISIGCYTAALCGMSASFQLYGCRS